MRALITGGGGLLGSAMVRRAPSGVEVHATYRGTRPPPSATAHRVELSDASAVHALVRELRPDVVIHTAYGTKDGERDIVRATACVADACADMDVRLVHVSTDALLDGEHAPYDESAEPSPVHEYGRWKAEAEQIVRERCPAAAIVRTSLIVGMDPPDPASEWVIGTLRRGEPLTLFTDEMRNPTLVDDLADALWEIAALLAETAAGVWNVCGPETVSRYDLGLLLAKRHGVDPSRIVPVPSPKPPSPRPRDLRMTTARADAILTRKPRPISESLFSSR